MHEIALLLPEDASAAQISARCASDLEGKARKEPRGVGV
jgi:hypothetical protein